MADINNGQRRLTPQEIAERFGAMKREHEARVERSKRHRARREEQENTREYLASQATPTVSANTIGDQLRDQYREGRRLRNPDGRFMGLPKTGPEG